jgi:hypothetical protein
MRADEKLTAFMELESAIRSATRGKTACYKNLQPGRAAKPYQRSRLPEFVKQTKEKIVEISRHNSNNRRRGSVLI